MKKQLTVVLMVLAVVLTGCASIKPLPVPDPSSSEKPVQETSVSSNSSSPYGTYPASESEFVATIESATKDLAGDITDLQRSQFIEMRDQKLCVILSGIQVDNWVGTVHDIGATGDGYAYVEIEIAPSIVVQTWNNALSDLLDKTLIKPDASFFKTVVPMKVGTKVSFSGDFVASTNSCLKRANITEVFYGTDPNFVFRFSNIANQ